MTFRQPNSSRSFLSATLPLLMLAWIIAPLLSGCGLQDLPQPSPTSPATSSPTDTATSLPDLAITSVSLEGFDGISHPCALGGPYRLRLVITNRGQADSGPFVVQADDQRRNILEGLPVGQQIEILFVVQSASPEIWVDATTLVAESDEQNNLWSGQLPTPVLPQECLSTPTPAVAFQHSLVTLVGHQAKVLCVAFSPDGNLIASGSVDNTLRLWQVNPGKLLRTMLGHPFPVLTVEFTPNGTVLATGSTDGVIRLWQVLNGSLQRTLKGHAGWVTALDISRDGRMLVSGGEDFTVRLWRLPVGTAIENIDEGMTSIKSVAFSPDGLKIAWGEEDGMVRVRTIDGNWVYALKETTYAASSVAFSPSGNLLVAGFSDGSLRAWQMSDGKQLQTLKSHSKTISSLAFSPDGRWLVAASHDDTLSLWLSDASGIQPIPLAIFTDHNGPVNSVDFSPRGNLIASASDDGTVRLWELPAGQPASTP
jgi:WD40 repeat protein